MFCHKNAQQDVKTCPLWLELNHHIDTLKGILGDGKKLLSGLLQIAKVDSLSLSCRYSPVSYTHLDVYKRQV